MTPLGCVAAVGDQPTTRRSSHGVVPSAKIAIAQDARLSSNHTTARLTQEPIFGMLAVPQCFKDRLDRHSGARSSSRLSIHCCSLSSDNLRGPNFIQRSSTGAIYGIQSCRASQSISDPAHSANRRHIFRAADGGRAGLSCSFSGSQDRSGMFRILNRPLWNSYSRSNAG